MVLIFNDILFFGGLIAFIAAFFMIHTILGLIVGGAALMVIAFLFADEPKEKKPTNKNNENDT